MTRALYTRNRPIVRSHFSEPVKIVRVNTQRNEYGEAEPQETSETNTTCSCNPISADDERLGDLQKSGVRLVGLREFFTIEPMDVESKDEFEWKGKRYVSIQTADWGYFQSTLASLKEGQHGDANA